MAGPAAPTRDGRCASVGSGTLDRSGFPRQSFRLGGCRDRVDGPGGCGIVVSACACVARGRCERSGAPTRCAIERGRRQRGFVARIVGRNLKPADAPARARARPPSATSAACDSARARAAFRVASCRRAVRACGCIFAFAWQRMGAGKTCRVGDTRSRRQHADRDPFGANHDRGAGLHRPAATHGIIPGNRGGGRIAVALADPVRAGSR